MECDERRGVSAEGMAWLGAGQIELIDGGLGCVQTGIVSWQPISARHLPRNVDCPGPQA